MNKLFYFRNVGFADLETVLRLFKKAVFPAEVVLDYFSQPENIRFVRERYNQLIPLTVKEAVKLDNIEQRMIALTCFQAEEIASELNAELVNEQSLEKKQFQWDENNRPVEKIYKDTYSLFRINASELLTPEEIEERDDDDEQLHFEDWELSPPQEYIYYVKCVCPSTGRNYFVYVDEEIGMEGDAVAAIAWTMRINGQPISKEMYLNLMYAES